MRVLDSGASAGLLLFHTAGMAGTAVFVFMPASAPMDRDLCRR